MPQTLGRTRGPQPTRAAATRPSLARLVDAPAGAAWTRVACRRASHGIAVCAFQYQTSPPARDQAKPRSALRQHA